MRELGQLALFILVVIGALSILTAVSRSAFGGGGGSSRKAASGKGRSALRSVASKPAVTAGGKAGKSAAAVVMHPRNSTVRTRARADIRRAWGEVKATDWLEQQRHARANGTATTDGTPAATAPKPTITQRLRLRPFVATPDSPGSGGGNGRAPGGNGSPPKPATAPPNVQAPPPASPARPASTNGGTPVAAGTSTASAEKLIEGINEIHAHAAAGGIHAKREAVKAAQEGLIRFSAMLQMLGRQMSEPGSNYGHEITEPLAQGGTHCQASAMSLSEADAALTTLINMTVGDLATSARQAPHHSELSESGTR